MRFVCFLLLLLVASSCTYTAKITDGATAVERKQYAVAVPMLKKEYRRAKSRSQKGRIAYDLAVALRETSDDAAAIDWFQTAYDNGVGPEALRERAAALKREERYEEAIQVYTDLGFEIGSKYEFRRDIAGAELAMQLLAESKEQPQEYEVAPAGFNSRQADYSPTLYAGDIVFTSDRGSATGEATYNWTGRGFTDLFIVSPGSDEVRGFDNTVNTTDNEGSPTFSADGNEMIFTRCSAPGKREPAFCALYRSEKSGGGWLPAERLSFIRPGVNYLHPALSADGTTLFFSAALPDGWGGYDLYYSKRTPEGDWAEPVSLNRGINTPGNEQFPSLDGDTLYFASDGLEGLGGLDIFRTYPMANGRYAAPRNLKMPINSGSDDFAYTIARRQGSGLEQETTGYFTSARPGGVGSDDIYAYTKRVLPPPPPSPDPVVYRNILDVYVVEKIYEDPTDPTSRVLGVKPVPNATIVARVGEQSRTVNTNEEGQLSLVLVDDQSYEFRAEREEYLADEGRFSSRNLPQDPDEPERRYELELEIEKIFRNREIVLENIYYDFDASDIRADAEPTLNELAQLLERNPDIRIELGSHTDCRGGDAYNQRLSQARAESAVTYLASQGIAPERLTARGYGETEPVAECLCARCTEEEHQRNRRTTFRILE